MNPTQQTAVISISDIYGATIPEIDPVYTANGEFRIPSGYDTFLSPKGEVCTLEPGDTQPKGPRIILRRTNMADVYGTFDPPIPEDWEDAGEFRLPKEGEYVLGANLNNQSTHTAIKCFTSRRTPRLILKKTLPKDTPEAAYEGKIPATPAGYVLEKFVRLGDVAADSVWLSNGGSTMRGVEKYEKNKYRYLLHPITNKFKVGDLVLVNGCVPARVLEIRENPGTDIFDTKVVFYKNAGFGGWQASKYMKLAPTTNRWLIEVESEGKPEIEHLHVRSDNRYGTNPIRHAVLSVTPKP